MPSVGEVQGMESCAHGVASQQVEVQRLAASC